MARCEWWCARRVFLAPVAITLGPCVSALTFVVEYNKGFVLLVRQGREKKRGKAGKSRRACIIAWSHYGLFHGYRTSGFHGWCTGGSEYWLGF